MFDRCLGACRSVKHSTAGKFGEGTGVRAGERSVEIADERVGGFTACAAQVADVVEGVGCGIQLRGEFRERHGRAPGECLHGRARGQHDDAALAEAAGECADPQDDGLVEALRAGGRFGGSAKLAGRALLGLAEELGDALRAACCARLSGAGPRR